MRLCYPLLSALTAIPALATTFHNGHDADTDSLRLRSSPSSSSDADMEHLVKSSFTPSESLLDEWELQPYPPSPDYTITLRFHLKAPSQNHQFIQDLLLSNHPSHSHWTRRKHLSLEEVTLLRTPPSDTARRFDAFLRRFGISTNSVHYDAYDTTRSRPFLPNIPLATAERLLSTQYGLYKNRKTGDEIVRTLEYSLPRDIFEDIEWVQPTNYFGSVKAHRRTSHRESLSASSPSDIVGTNLIAQGGAGFLTNITLSILQNLYNLTNNTPSTISAKAGNMLGIAGYLEQYANLADLKQFYQLNLPAATNSTLSVVLLNGAINSQTPTDAGVEANLDVQFGGGLSYPLPNIFYSTYGRGENTQPNISYTDNGNEPYDVFLSYLLARNDSDLPLVLSTSYGEFESDVPIDYATSVCNMYAQLGARGVSVLHSSGDWGAGVGPSDNQNSACGSPNRFKVVFPSSCPYVTSVGGTYMIPETTNTLSGGGFSDYFSRPSYQDSAVSKYLSGIGSTYNGMYNASGRAQPDISAQSHNFQVVIDGQLTGVSGTSAACPTVAAIVALLNDALLKNGRESLGFLNPFIYSLATSGLNDITSGNNPGCGVAGWNATTGWDPATGNGTPNFGLLRDIVLSSAYASWNASQTTSASTGLPTGTGGQTKSSAMKSMRVGTDGHDLIGGSGLLFFIQSLVVILVTGRIFGF
ncbi:subtilisin-like protein [Clavulina sp. PMI_390]|nr:subtilisin-like protein [Clavulina sp. PMI_390]